jgi:ABC-type bacteriocin/lantibiotic exporter with double-glycine peptidase domain
MAPSAAGVWLAALSWLTPFTRAEGPVAWIDVPFVKQQEANGCGAAAIAMLMRYWARDGADPHKIYLALNSQQERGIRGADVEQYLRESGFQTFVFQGEWHDLEQQVAKGRPLMICLRTDGAASFHYVVIAGVDSSSHLVLVNDPARRKLTKIDRHDFEKDWNAANRWTLLAVPKHPR